MSTNGGPDLPIEPMLIGGVWIAVSGVGRLDVVDPADAVAFACVPQAGPGDVDQAVSAAAEAHHDRRWSGLPPASRRDVLNRLAELVERDAEAIAQLETRDMGKPMERSRGDVTLAVEGIRYFAGAPQRLGAGSLPGSDDAVIYGRRLEVGTVWVNTYNRFDGPLSFGGYKQSGLGRELGDAALDTYTELKNVVVSV